MLFGISDAKSHKKVRFVCSTVTVLSLSHPALDFGNLAFLKLCTPTEQVSSEGLMPTALISPIPEGRIILQFSWLLLAHNAVLSNLMSSSLRVSNNYKIIQLTTKLC